MATNISGLFGDITKTPQQYRDEALQGMLVSPAQMGSQGLYQQLISTMGNAGANIGSGLGGLLGGKTAAEVRDNQLNAAMQEVSQGQYANEWEKLDALAKKLAGQGLGAEAQKAAEQANKMKLTDLQMQKAQRDLQPEPYKNISREVQSVDPYSGKVTVQTVTETMKWNSETKQYEPINRSSGGQGGDGGGDGGGGQGGNDQQAKAKAILEQRKAGGTYTNPVATPRMPQGTPIPPDLRNQRGFQGQGMINPEGF